MPHYKASKLNIRKGTVSPGQQNFPGIETDAILILLKMLKKPIISFISVHSISNIYLFTGIM